MKRIALATVLLMICTSCYSPERDCDKFKTGTFEFQSYLNGEIVTSTFVRNDSIEIDKFQGKTDTSSVRWINKCEYILKNLHPKNRAERQPLHIKILTTKGNSYTFEYGMVGDTKKQKGRVTRIK
ncbi:hypothetical protein BH23BAC2_BH23BAC2_16780 [soil metagenome]